MEGHVRHTACKATINGVQLHYEIRGDGSHPIICIPGAIGTAKMSFEPQLDYFGRQGSGFTVVSFDPRGYGASRPAERFGKNFFICDAMDANALMQHLSLPKYSVLGFCNGGTAGLFLTSMCPDNIRKFVAWGTIAYTTPEDLEIYENIRDISNWNKTLRDTLVEIYGESLQSMWSEWIDSVKDIVGKDDGDICKGELCKIKCPTLIVHGAKDLLVPSLHPTYLHEHITDSQLIVMDDGKHWLHQKYAEDFNKIVEEFLNK